MDIKQITTPELEAELVRRFDDEYLLKLIINRLRYKGYSVYKAEKNIRPKYDPSEIDKIDYAIMKATNE